MRPLPNEQISLPVLSRYRKRQAKAQENQAAVGGETRVVEDAEVRKLADPQQQQQQQPRARRKVCVRN